MKIEPGKCEYPLPDCGYNESVCLDEGEREMRGHVYPMIFISPLRWAEMRGDPRKPPTRGRPVYFAWFGDDTQIRIYPAPASEGELRIRYYPHLREA